MSFFIKREALGNIEQLAREGFPYEICGFLGGCVLGQAIELKPARNISIQPQVEYDIAPEQTVESLLAFEVRGMKLTGLYHSHPRYPARPSQSDIRLADLPGVVYLITSVYENNNGALDCETRAYRIEKGRAHETKLVVV